MIINGRDFPNIGHIRPKQLRSGEWELDIHPPTRGPLQGHEPAYNVEIVVSAAEVERIKRVAPHLFPQPCRELLPYIHPAPRWQRLRL